MKHQAAENPDPKENSGRQLKEDLERIYIQPAEDKEERCSGSDSPSESCKE